MSRWQHHRDDTLRGNYLGGSSKDLHFPALEGLNAHLRAIT
jgi:hypothetical protein